ncbi:MAG: DUF6252 family protein [Chitinophagaceae bacterium]
MFRTLPLFAIILFTMLVTSCQKEISIELGNGSVTIVSGELKMKINGSQWTASKDARASILGGYISINGLSPDNKSLSITLNDSVPGTYILDQMSFHFAALSDSSDLGGLSCTTEEGTDTSKAGGVVIVTSIDKVNKTISGTFHFKLYRDFDSKQKIVTEGVFTKLPYSVTLPPASLTDTFHVKIDNVDWTAKSLTAISSGSDLIVNASERDLTRIVALSFPATIVPGTYNLDALAGIYVGVYAPNTTTFFTSLTGKLTIIEHNSLTKRIKGNFDFKAIDLGTSKSAQLSAGYFSIGYQ